MRDLFEEDGRGQGVEGTGEAGEQGRDVDHDDGFDRWVQNEGMCMCMCVGFKLGWPSLGSYSKEEDRGRGPARGVLVRVSCRHNSNWRGFPNKYQHKMCPALFFMNPFGTLPTQRVPS